MTNEELFIAFGTKLNRLTGMSFDGLSREEVDWVIQEALYIFIENPKGNTIPRREGFYDTKNRAEELEVLMTSVSLPVIKNDEDSVYSILPPDYLKTTEIVAIVNSSCNKLDDIETEVTEKWFSYKLPIIDVTILSIQATIDAVLTPVVLLADISPTSIVADLNYVIAQRLANKVNAGTLFKVYWERYNNIYLPREFIFVYQGAVADFTGATIIENAVTTIVPPQEITTTRVSFTGSERKVACRLTDAEMLQRNLSDPFRKSVRESPVVVLEGGKVTLHHQDDFNVKGIRLNYLRTPRVVDYTVGQSIELGTTTGMKRNISEKVLDIAVQLAASRLTTPAAQSITQQHTIQ
jgi:hypothetical protein